MENTFPQTPSQEQARVVPDATPRPWIIAPDKFFQRFFIKGTKRVFGNEWHVRVAKTVSTIGDDTEKANAELIVRAVNSFDALVEALQELYDATPKGFGNDYGLEDALKKTEAALKLARV